jgi:hypothetical protein
MYGFLAIKAIEVVKMASWKKLTSQKVVKSEPLFMIKSWGYRSKKK